MSMSPQNGGFHFSTGGSALPPSRGSAAAIPSSPPIPKLCPAFAIVFLELYRSARACSQLCDHPDLTAEDSVSLAENDADSAQMADQKRLWCSCCIAPPEAKSGQ